MAFVLSTYIHVYRLCRLVTSSEPDSSLRQPIGVMVQTTENRDTPGLSSGGMYNVERVFDRLGRPLEIEYGDVTTTPLVTFAYDGAGNRAAMREYNSSGQIRKTEYLYDDARRLSAVGFDIDGDDAIEEVVSYEYDLGGLRTRMTLPDNLSISYRYDARGQLVGLTDWDGQASDFFYDKARRHVGTQRPGSFASIYRYSLAGHLQRIEHSDGGKPLARFVYTVDGRGSRTEASERLARQAAVVDTIGKDDEGIAYRGTWVDDGDFKVSTQFSAQMTLAFVGQDAALIVGTGPDHGIFDVYVDGSLWESFDGYAQVAGERVINLHLTRSGLVTFEIRNRATKNLRSSGYRMRFHALVVLETAYDERTIRYTYDALSRLVEADYGAEQHTYGFDLAGNLTNLNGVSRTYNAANQLTHDGTNTLTYDANGNMTSDGANAYTWDRANRLLNMGGISYQYNGDGNRIQQDALKYILDLQPGLAQVIGDSAGNRFVHGPRGMHAAHDGATWAHPLTDGLGSVRGYVDTNGEVLSTVHYSEYGVPDASIVGPAFTGEWRDASTGVQYHRARYYDPNLATWLSLDPFEGMMERPMSLNGYTWVEGNTPNMVDPSGKQPPAPPIPWDDILREAIESINNRPVVLDEAIWGEAIRQALQRRGIAVTAQLVAQGLARLSAAGIAVTTLIPVQQPNGLVCNAWEYQLGLCHPVWDNPTTYQGLATQPQLGWQPIDLGDLCMAMPLPLPQIIPFNSQVVESVIKQTRTRSQGSCEPHAFEQWWNGLPDAPIARNGSEDYQRYEARVARGVGTMGTSKTVPTGAISAQFGTILQNVNADGANSANCRILEAKWAGGGQYRSNNPPPWLSNDVDADFDLDDLAGELLRYRMAIYSNVEPVALEIRTNTQNAKAFFLATLPQFGFVPDVDAFVEIVL